MHKLAQLLATPGREALYRNLVSQWHQPSDIVLEGTELPTAMDDNSLSQKIPDYIAWMQLMDMRGYLPDDILTKVDRASMAISLEARVPLLDSDVVDFAMSLPLNMKIRAGKSKWLLRQVLHRYVPKRLVDRPKMGFGVPIGDWLRTELRDWAEDLLDEKRMKDDGIFNPAPIRQMWSEHLAERQNWQYPLWVVLMFQAWRNSTTGAGTVLSCVDGPFDARAKLV
jgi:asparagine synthase (glutamine-hydrolysing)